MIFPAATIDGEALRHNLAAVRRIAPASRVLAVIKANAYGHGIVETARALYPADAFGVARIGEGLALRAAGIRAPILLLEGVFSQDELQRAAAEQFELVIHEFTQVALLEQPGLTHRFVVWIKLNTGMNRLGFAGDEFFEALRRLRACAAVAQIRVMTHLAGAEEAGGE
ncbi:MAG TPA: alanine racemase, partial [Povalibacter sp.]|nr:alanine racemase [Povalibacter sp.]